MFDVFKVATAFRAALLKVENWTDNGPNWDFVDADTFMESKPQTPEQVNQYYQLLDDLVLDIIHHWGDDVNTYDGYIAAKEKIDAEYAELFGVSV